MSNKRILSVTGATLAAMLMCSGIARADFTENFDALTDGTSVNNLTNWSGPVTASPGADVAVRLNSITNEESAIVGQVGYGTNSKGVEFNFQDQALRSLTVSEAVTTAGGPAAFEAKVRIASIQTNNPGTTNPPIAAGVNHSFTLLIGENLGYASELVDATDAVAFAVTFYGGATSSIRVSNGSQGFDPSVAGVFTNLANPWSVDTWYTVMLSNIALSDSGDGTNVTATLDIINTDTLASLVSGATVTANLGSAAPGAGAFDQIDSIGLQNIRGNGIATLDDLSLVVPEPASLALLCLGGLLMFKRR
ncbi:MAG: PEP-CTERM sorting domain-containing protein [Phycisphaeraceae bacterium]